MATPPRISDGELAAMLDRIHARHRKIDDPHLDRWEHEPRAVLEYLIRYGNVAPVNRSEAGTGHLPRWVAQADAYDAVMLLAWLWWDDRRRERAVLRRGLTLGLSALQLGAPLGIVSRQGIPDRLDRLDALLDIGRPDEKETRSRRASARSVAAGKTPTKVLPRDRIVRLALALVAAADDFHVTDREFCDELAGEPFVGEGPSWTDPASVDLPESIFALLGLAAAEVQTDPAVLVLPPAHPVHRLVQDVQALRQEFMR